MRYYLSLIGIFISTCLFAQKNPFEIKRCSAVIKGNVKNNTDQFWEFAQTGYFNNELVSVPIDKNGNFNKTISLDGDMQDIYLYLNNDAITIYVQKNDTIEINWDAKDFNTTFKLKNTDKIRNNELQTMLALYNKYRKPILDLMRSLYAEKWSDSLKFSKINDLYNQELQTVLDNKEGNCNKILIDLYYQYTYRLQSANLLHHYSLKVNDVIEKSDPSNFALNKDYYLIESEEAFDISNTYREFLFNYICFNKSLRGVSSVDNDYSDTNTTPFSPPWTDYYTGLSEFKLYQLRDWFITRSIKFDFQFYSFDDAQAVYKDFITKIKVPAYADTLAVFYKNALTLKPGNMAPNFTLPGVNGKPVSLSDMRGQVVLIDFWGVGCGPCMHDIKEDVPQLHERYKGKNIVFVNICVDSPEAVWKNSLKETGLSGINLIGEGWTKNPVIKQYGIQGIPHYMVIDADGKIVNNNSPGPSQSDSLYAELDKAIAK